MKRLCQLLCVVTFAAAAYAQSASPSFVTRDPSLAGEMPAQTTAPAPVAKPSAATPRNSAPIAPAPKSAEVHVLPATLASEPLHDLQVRASDQSSPLPMATVLRVKLTHPITTAKARPGEQLWATLSSPVMVNGNVVVSAGAVVQCELKNAHGSRRFAGKPLMTIKARSLRMPDGTEMSFNATLVDTGSPRHLDVDQEGRVRGTNHNPMNNVELATLAGVGAIAGTVIAGPEGLLWGTASGVMLAAGHIIVKHRELTLPAGTELIFELDGPAAMVGPRTAQLHPEQGEGNLR
jgi:hypothetical protein